ncbi:MAG: hypothetical protein NWE95_07350 [Candidatus Bathyarchaeota archaeon]|nr:hypothetical protein [Candidatus Bathyarchaeota archaeon]
MPITRKICTIGRAKGVTLPASWLKYFERQNGEPLREVAMEINGAIVIRPIPPVQQQTQQ